MKKVPSNPLAGLLPHLAFFVAMLALRWQVVSDLQIGLSEAFALGLGWGVLFDFMVVFLPPLVARLLWLVIKLPLRAGWIVSALFVWIASLANTLHMRFFQIPLDWWIVRMHWRDVFEVHDSAEQLAATPAIVASAMLFIGAIVLACTHGRMRVRWPKAPTFTPKRRIQVHGLMFAETMLFALTVFLMWGAPIWSGSTDGATLLKDHVVRAWAMQNFRSHLYAKAGASWGEHIGNGLSEEEQRSPSQLLADYRDRHDSADSQTTQLSAQTLDANWPLLRQIDTIPEDSEQLRQRLGLPLQGPLNIVVLFVESWRAYEVFHPELRKIVFPHVSDVLDKHSIAFKQAYSSSFRAGQTVRGQFSTLCSMLPNMTGAAEYIAHTNVRLTCMQEFLKNNGYQTVWMNSHDSTFHHKRYFEVLHGTQTFYDKQHYLSRGITEQIGNMGLADGPVLQESLRLMVELANKGQPLFANVLTTSSHHPFSVIPQGKLPSALAEQTKESKGYQGYLSRMIYVDRALGDFFEAFFKSPIADNTVIALLGDHGTPQMPNIALTAAQRMEMMFRIPIALITKNMPQPQVIETPVHQIDVVPTLTRISGLHGPMTWVGKGLLSGEGSAWMYQTEEEHVSYRTSARGCYSLNGEALRCFDVQDKDPLYDAHVQEVPEDVQTSLYFKRVVEANRTAIVLNRIAPLNAATARVDVEH